MKTLDDLTNEYITHLRSIKSSPETIRKTKEKLYGFNRWAKENFDVITIDGLRLDHLKRWHGYLATIRTNKGRPLKARSVNLYIIKLRGFIKYLASNGYVQSKLLDVLPYVKEPLRLPGSVMTHVQTKKLLSKIATDSAEGYRDRAMFELLYSTGIRVGELLMLDVEDIDFKNRTALVTGKGNKQRMVPVGKTALRYLESYVKAVRPYLLRIKAQKALFLNSTGGRLSYSSFRRIMRKVADRAGLDVHVTAHTFRRSCTTELIRGGANMYHVKELLGHESLDTLKPYTRLTIIDLKKTHQKCHPRERERS